MNISICITVLNEEGTISSLLDSLVGQTKKAGEIVIVDGGSSDSTIEIVNHYQKRFGGIRLLKEKCSRARGRNLGVEIAKGEIIAMTDAGCTAEPDWLKKLTAPFLTGRVDVSAGFYHMVASSAYHMTGGTPVSRAMGVFLGVRPRKFDANFLSSTRSIAFTKKIWTEVGGFPEDSKGTAEDTVFNYKLIKAGAKFSRVKDAVVEWGMPTSIYNFYLKIFNYAKGDAKSKIWFFPGKGLTSHNIKALSILFRYFCGLVLLVLLINKPVILVLLLLLVILYFLWSFRKIYIEFGEWKTAFWGPLLQLTCDFGVISGFVSGILER